MAYYPVFLEMKGRPCLVIGGGEVACQKAFSLLACGAKVTVVSPQLGDGLKRLLRSGKIRWRKQTFKPEDLGNMELVVAATNQQPVNRLAWQTAKKKGLWINVVDRPRLCSFIVPSVLRRGKLVLAISTGGVSPALAKWIRRDLESRYSSEFGRLLQGMSRVRAQVRRKVGGVGRRKRVFEKALAAYFKVLEREVS